MFNLFKILALGIGITTVLACLTGESAVAEQWLRKNLSTDFYSEGGSCGDIDQDGHVDLVAGPFVYYGPDFEVKSNIYEPKPFSINGYSDNFLNYTHDINADGLPDVIVFDFPGKQTWYLENPGKEVRKVSAWSKTAALESTDNESPMLKDITGDGRPEIICCQGGQFGYAEIPSDPKQLWTFVPVSENGGYQRFTHGIGVGDVNDDGLPDMMASNGWWKNPGSKATNSTGSDELDTESKLWDFHPFAFAETAAQLFAVDLDGDHQTEVITSLQAHGYGLVIYNKIDVSENEQWTWQSQTVMTDDPTTSPTQLAISQLHAIDIADFNNDGVPDILTGKRFWAHQGHDVAENAVPYLVWFETIRGGNHSVRFVPHIIDDDSGVGTEITAFDINGDGLQDVFSASKRGVNVFLQTNDNDPSGHLNRTASIESGFKKIADRITVVGTQDPSFSPADESERPLNLDFEAGGLQDWKATGAAFFKQPVAWEQIKDKQPITSANAQTNKYLVATDVVVGEIGEGEMFSRPFTLSKPWISFLIAGSSTDLTQMQLVDFASGEIIAKQSGLDSSLMKRVSLDVSGSVGKTVYIRIIDHGGAKGDFLRFDDFKMHDIEPK